MSPALHRGEEINGVSYASYDAVTKKQTKYACLTTNDLIINADKAFEVYNKRANIENAIKELKEDYGLGKIITESFDTNDVITQVQVLTYTLVQLLKNEVLPPKMSRMRLSTLRTQVFKVPAGFFIELKIEILKKAIFGDT